MVEVAIAEVSIIPLGIKTSSFLTVNAKHLSSLPVVAGSARI